MNQGRQGCGKAYGDTICKRGMQRNKVSGKQRPYNSSDISGKEAGYGSEKISDNYDNKCKCSEMNRTRDQRDRTQISPKDTCQNTKYNKENDVNK